MARSSPSPPRARRSPRRMRARAARVEEILWDDDAAEGRLRHIHAQGDRRAARLRCRDHRRPPPGHRAHEPLRARPRSGVPAEHAPDRDRRLRHELPRRAGRPLRDRAVGAGPRRGGHRLGTATAIRSSHPRTWSSASPSRARPPTCMAAMRLAREKGATVATLTNVMGSQATRDSDAVLFTGRGARSGWRRRRPSSARSPRCT